MVYKRERQDYIDPDTQEPKAASDFLRDATEKIERDNRNEEHIARLKNVDRFHKPEHESIKADEMIVFDLDGGTHVRIFLYQGNPTLIYRGSTELQDEDMLAFWREWEEPIAIALERQATTPQTITQ